MQMRSEDPGSSHALSKSIGHANDTPLVTINTKSAGSHGSNCAYTDTARVRSRVHKAWSTEVI